MNKLKIIKNDLKFIEDKIDERKTVEVDGKFMSLKDLKRKTKESIEKLVDSGLPQELIDLMKNSEGMKIDEFYKKMGEVSRANGIDVKHSELGNEILQGKDVVVVLKERNKHSNIIHFDKQ